MPTRVTGQPAAQPTLLRRETSGGLGAFEVVWQVLVVAGWSVTPSPKLPRGSQLTGVTAPAPDDA
jgi:hypothetical protein